MCARAPPAFCIYARARRFHPFRGPASLLVRILFFASVHRGRCIGTEGRLVDLCVYEQGRRARLDSMAFNKACLAFFTMAGRQY